MKVWLLLLSSLISVTMAIEERFVTSGLFRGRVESTHTNGISFVAFRNIPYAKPPTGSRRFRIPEVLEYSSEVFDASSPTELQCPQLASMKDAESSAVVGVEDCLVLNVFVPEDCLLSSSTLPVLVFLHGDDFRSGSSADLEKETLMDSGNLILVTVNYRLGPLGWLSLEDELVAGNLGLHDQLLALKWVNNLIDKFNGDAAKVTLAGHGSGATSALIHLVSPRSKGLFTALIAHAGRLTTLLSSELFTHESASHYARTLADAVDCDINGSSEELLLCLQSKSVDEMIERSNINEDLPGWPNPWQPLVDNYTQDWILPRAPQELFESAVLNANSLLIGANELQAVHEVRAIVEDAVALKELQADFEASGPVVLFNKERDAIDDEDGPTVEIIRMRYLDNGPGSCSKADDAKINKDKEDAKINKDEEDADKEDADKEDADKEDEEKEDEEKKETIEEWTADHVLAFTRMVSDARYHLPNRDLVNNIVDHSKEAKVFKYMVKSKEASESVSDWLSSSMSSAWLEFATSGRPSSSWLAYTRSEPMVALLDEESMEMTTNEEHEEDLEFIDSTIKLMETVRNMDMENHPAVVAANERRDEQLRKEWEQQERLERLQRARDEDYNENNESNDEDDVFDDDFEEVEDNFEDNFEDYDHHDEL